ncbi:DUF4153 domain-containing protein [Alkalibacterium sp. 20]|uniref:DUF4153 domain-containing protein n=1 Tax=Alkalibacterium sp. 20 TaxID=1798803 RepID=UPI0008FFF583|nr:DUF4153 domain-containing protein [Alkalibacterium sp. 20]OJF94181.1 hypothetical protein AX762_07680 [Alkalibacterium sp. 20]
MSVKDWLIQRKTQWLATFSRFPIAIALLVLIVMFTLADIYSRGEPDYMNHVLSLGLGILLVVSIQLYSERLLIDKLYLWGIKLGSLILPLLYYFYLRQAPLGFNQSGSIRTLVLYFIFVILLLVTPTLRSRLTFSDSLIIYIQAFFSSLLISVILFIGISAILSAYTTLIYNLDARWFSYSAAIVYLFVGPVYLLSRLPVFDETIHDLTINEAKSIPPLLEILIAYIIIPVLLVFSAILIAYILINISGEFWKDNLMEPLLISYTIAGIVTLFLAENVDKKLSRMFSRFFPYLLFVVAIFQTVSSSLKTYDIGLTHGRYFVLLFGVFSIISTLIYSFLKSKKILIPFLLIGLGVISILPMIDAVSIGINNQLSKVNNIVESAEIDEETTLQLDKTLSDEEKAKFSYSMNYLNQQEQLDQLDWLPSSFDYYRDFEQTFGFNPSFHYYYGSDIDGPFPSDSNYAYMELDMTQPNVIPLADVDELVELSTYQDLQINVDLDNEPYSLKFVTERDAFSVELLENDSSVLTYDLSFIRELAYEVPVENSQQPLEKMMFTEENEDVRLTVILRRLTVEGNTNIEGEFLILITYK